MPEAETTAPKVHGVPFQTGDDSRRNTAGRPKGSRNKLGEDFLKALHEDFQEHGVTAIQEVRANKPDAYLKVIASILPKQAEIKINDFDSMDDGQLRNALAAAIRDLATFGVDIGAAGGPVTIDAVAVQSSQPVPAIQ